MTMNDTNPTTDHVAHPPASVPAPPPAPARPTWSKGKIIGAVVVAVAVAATAGITVAVVDKSSGTGNSAAGANGQFPGGGPAGQNGFGGPGGGMRGMGGGLAGALHGTIVVSDNGQYVTEEIQTGKVTAISASSITVASTDNYTKTYVLGSSTTVNNGNAQIGSVATGHTVSVTATVSGDTATVTQLLDQTS